MKSIAAHGTGWATLSRARADGVEPAKVMVYAVDYRDNESRSWIRSPALATSEAISSNGWRAVAGSGRQIARDLISSNGIAYEK